MANILTCMRIMCGVILVTVTNTGNVKVTDIKVTDPLKGVAPVGSTTIESLEPGDSADVKFTYVVTMDDSFAREVKNTATAEGTPEAGDLKPVVPVKPANPTPIPGKKGAVDWDGDGMITEWDDIFDGDVPLGGIDWNGDGYVDYLDDLEIPLANVAVTGVPDAKWWLLPALFSLIGFCVLSGRKRKEEEM